jgi:hypothetical protein
LNHFLKGSTMKVVTFEEAVALCRGLNFQRGAGLKPLHSHVSVTMGEGNQPDGALRLSRLAPATLKAMASDPAMPSDWRALVQAALASAGDDADEFEDEEAEAEAIEASHLVGQCGSLVKAMEQRAEEFNRQRQSRLR